MGSDASEILQRFRNQYIIVPDKVIAVEEVVVIKPDIIKRTSKSQLFMVSAYDLSQKSCNKSRSDPNFGITSSGVSLEGHSWKNTRIVAADPRVLPLGTRVLINFTDKQHQKYSGEYKVGDYGGAIQGNKLDLFIEDGNGRVSKEALIFGITHANVTILKD